MYKCLLLLLLFVRVQEQPAGNSASDVVVKKNVMVPMRDGVRLSCDIYFPGKDGQTLPGRFPVLLNRSPYSFVAYEGMARNLATRGYVVVLNYVRGRFESEGTWRLMLDDGRDGYDLVEWIAQQEWSTGKIGTYGVSYNGGTQHALAEMNPPHLTAMIPTDALANAGVAGIRHGGLLNCAWPTGLSATTVPTPGRRSKIPC